MVEGKNVRVENRAKVKMCTFAKIITRETRIKESKGVKPKL